MSQIPNVDKSRKIVRKKKIREYKAAIRDINKQLEEKGEAASRCFNYYKKLHTADVEAYRKEGYELEYYRDALSIKPKQSRSNNCIII